MSNHHGNGRQAAVLDAKVGEPRDPDISPVSPIVLDPMVTHRDGVSETIRYMAPVLPVTPPVTFTIVVRAAIARYVTHAKAIAHENGQVYRSHGVSLDRLAIKQTDGKSGKLVAYTLLATLAKHMSATPDHIREMLLSSPDFKVRAKTVSRETVLSGEKTKRVSTKWYVYPIESYADEFDELDRPKRREREFEFNHDAAIAKFGLPAFKLS